MRNCSLRAISPFPTMFLKGFFPSHVKKVSLCGNGLNNHWFLRVCSTSLSKTLLEKDEFLVMSNFSFLDSVLYPFGELFAFFIKFKTVVCQLSQFGRVYNLLFGKEFYVTVWEVYPMVILRLI